MNLSRCTLFPALILIASQAFSQQVNVPVRYEFSLQQCIDYAEKNNAYVKNALLDIDIQEQQNRNITAAAYPQINGSFNTQYNPNITVQSFPNFISPATYQVLVAEGVKNGNGDPIKMPADFGVIQAAFGTKWIANGGITLSQILFDGQVFVGLQARKTTIDYRTRASEVTKQEIRTNVAKIYYQLTISRTQVQLIDANIARADKLLKDSRELYKNGFAEKLDATRAAVQLTNFQATRQTTINSISNGYLGLKLLMGMPIEDTLILTDTITNETIEKGLLNDGVYKYEDRPEYNALSAYEKLQEFNVRRYKLSKIPTASLTAGYSKLAQRSEFNLFSAQPWFSSSYIGLTVDVPIFSGFAKNANIKQAELERQQAANNLDYLKLQIDQQVDSSITSFNNAVITMNNQQENVKLAEEAYDLTKKKYESGLASTTDISNAQSDLSTAQTNYLIALYNAGLAKIDYLKAIGKL